MLAKVFLMDSKELHHEESCYARLKLKEPLPCKRGDRFVVRFYSPLETIGGGVILNSIPQGGISRTAPVLDALKLREFGSAADIAGLVAFQLGRVLTEKELCKFADLDKTSCNVAIKTLVANGHMIKLSQDKYISAKVLKRMSKDSKDILDDYHKVFPLRAGMNIAELRQKLLPDADTSEANAVLNALNNSEAIKLTEKTASLPDFSIAYTPTQEKIKEKILTLLLSSGYDVPSPDELTAKFAKGEKREFEQVFESLISSGELIKLTPQIYWLKSVYEKAMEKIRGHFSKNEEITLAQCRDMLGTSRKYALALLEHLDGKQITQMQGDVRKL